MFLLLSIFLRVISSTLISDGSIDRVASIFLVSDEGETLKQFPTNYSTVDEYTCGIADTTKSVAYLLVSSPPSIIWPDRTYIVSTLDLKTGQISISSSKFNIPGVFPYGITLGPNGKVIVSGQSGPVLYYYLVDPNTGNQTQIAQIDIQNSFIFPDSMIYVPETNLLYHPYCDEPEHFIGVVTVDVARKTAVLIPANGNNLLWYRPVVYNPATGNLLGLLRNPHTTDATTLASFSLTTKSFTEIGSAFTGTQDLTFESADLSADGKTLFVTGSDGIFGTGKPFLVVVNVEDGSSVVKTLNPGTWLPVEFLNYYVSGL